MLISFKRIILIFLSTLILLSVLIATLNNYTVQTDAEISGNKNLVTTVGYLTKEEVLLGDLIKLKTRLNDIKSSYSKIDFICYFGSKSSFIYVGNNDFETRIQNRRKCLSESSYGYAYMNSSNQQIGTIKIFYNSSSINFKQYLNSSFVFSILILLLFTLFIGFIFARLTMNEVHSLLFDKQSSRIRISEFLKLSIKYKRMKESIISKEKALATSVAKETIAKQVAHDIRSPLAALDMIVNEVDQLPEEQRSIIRNATRRIHDIADNHLNRNSKNDKNLKDDIDQHMLSALIEPLMAEKRTQYRNKIGLEIEAEFNKENYGLFVNVNAVEFKRVLSNLVNNSVEALEGPGRVHVLTTYTESLAKIQITDNGPGIPKSILPHITEKGATFGKTGGTGLGLYHAKKSVESWGGHFEVLSRINQGTTIAITLPLVQTPKWFLSQLNLKPNQNLIILDDDITMHQVWKEILRKFELNECGINIKSFATAEQLRSWYLESDQNENNRYLFDYEILGTNTTGLDLIEELDLKGGRAILVTSHYESGEIRKRCEKIKVPLLPKNLAPFVPISINKEASTDAVFIDDDDLVRNLWKIKASLKDVKLKTFSNKDDLIKFLPEIQKFTPIYIDSNLGEDIKGEDLALELHDQGFSEIFLATGYDPSNYEGCHYLKGVIGKTPPF